MSQKRNKFTGTALWKTALLPASVLWTYAMGHALAQNSPLVEINNAGCVATDDLGRRLPTYAETGPPKANRWVGNVLLAVAWAGSLGSRL